MRTTATARRFAKALIDVGREMNAYEKFGKELRTAVAVFEGTPELGKVLLNPMYRLEERKGLIAKVAEAMEASPEVAKFLSILVDTRKITLLDEIAMAYAELEDALAGRIRATVEAPGELDEALMADIKEKLKSATGRDVLVGFRKNPELVGGLVIKIGNTVLDGSVKTQLELMKEKILEGVV